MDEQPAPERPAPHRRASPALQRRLDAIFGDVLPETTRDERDDRELPGPSADDVLLADRPPHHDRA